MEDDPAQSQRWQALFATHNLAVHCMRPAQLLAAPIQPQPDVILIGGLPGTHGRQLIHWIRLLDIHAPIILLDDTAPLPPDPLGNVQVCLPADTPEPSLLREVQEHLCLDATGDSARQTRGHVLVVDDDPRVCALLTSFLDLKGYSAIAASSGEEALLAAASECPKAVLLDIKMAGMDGIQTLTHLRAMCPAVPVIVITQMDQEGIREAVHRLGVDAYLLKPFHFGHLETLLRQLTAPAGAARGGFSQAAETPRSLV